MPTKISRILAVEDDPNDLALLVRLLHKFRVELTTVRNGTDALDYLFSVLSNHPQPLPNLILLDLILPRMHGFDVLYRIRSNDRIKNIPVIVVTNSVSERDAVNCYQLGIDAYLAKPVKLSTLMESFEALGIRPHSLPNSADQELVRE